MYTPGLTYDGQYVFDALWPCWSVVAEPFEIKVPRLAWRRRS
jgi:hypothetical protein